MTGPLPDGCRPLTLAPKSRYHGSESWPGGAAKHPGPWRHLPEQVMQVALYYSQTRSRQEAGLFDFRESERRQ